MKTGRTTLEKKILKNIEIFRDRSEKSQDQMAELMNISQSKYARFESGKTKTDLNQLINFCESLNTTLIDLVTYPEKYVKSGEEMQDPIRATVTIELLQGKKDQVLKLVLGDNYKEILK